MEERTNAGYIQVPATEGEDDVRVCKNCSLDISWKTWSKSEFCCSACRQQYPEIAYNNLLLLGNVKISTHIKYLMRILGDDKIETCEVHKS